MFVFYLTVIRFFLLFIRLFTWILSVYVVLSIVFIGRLVIGFCVFEKGDVI